jgi:hypothetical protein
MIPRLLCILCLYTISDAAFAQDFSLVYRELTQLKPGETAHTWIRDHPGEQFVTSSPENRSPYITLRPCAEADKSIVLGEAKLLRRALFFTPEGEKLIIPEGEDLHPELARDCELGLIFIESTDRHEFLKQHLVELDTHFSRIGTGQPFQYSKGATFWSGAMWADAQQWSTPQARYVTGLTREGKFVAFGIAHERDHNDKLPIFGYDPELTERAVALLPKAAMPEPDVAAMQQLLSHKEGIPSTSDGRAVQIIANWVSKSQHLPTEQRASALYIADVALEQNLSLGYERKDRWNRADYEAQTGPAREKLSALGLKLQYDQIGAAYTFDNAWIQKAFALAPQSEAGEAAFLFMLNRGFALQCCCSSGEFAFQTVIPKAKEYLAKYPQSGIRQQVLLALADSYRDIVASAHSDDTVYGDPDQFKPQSAVAYKHAISYYREAASLDPQSLAGLEARKNGWQLSAGITPIDTRFVCIYD